MNNKIQNLECKIQILILAIITPRQPSPHSLDLCPKCPQHVCLEIIDKSLPQNFSGCLRINICLQKTWLNANFSQVSTQFLGQVSNKPRTDENQDYFLVCTTNNFCDQFFRDQFYYEPTCCRHVQILHVYILYRPEGE